MSSGRVGYLVADIVGAVRVSSTSTALPQLRHVWLVSPPDVTVSHKPTPEHGGREGGGGGAGRLVDFCQSGESAGFIPEVERSVGGRESVGGPNEPLQN